MIKTIITITRKLVSVLNYIVLFLESKDQSDNIKSKFVDLAPTDNADKAGVYSEAILFAINNAKVFNIALTGPYGSGKSSIIQTFLKKHKRPSLHISLASFVPEINTGDETVSRQEIERSILQQMLYGADANKLPLSRFKRIKTPSVWSVFKTLYIMLGILSIWYVLPQREDIISGSFFLPFSYGNWLNLGSILLSVTFLWSTLHHFYVASFGLSLKSISLTDVEIKPANDNQESILNRHLDEIVYFFQSTSYDLVIIEDLDRFNDAEIFVTLREINSLVNENAGVKHRVKFLYALRDDMFLNTERTKFFEFIIPVIPIINTSNSIDMMLEQGKRLDLDDRLDRQFLREVSRYLNDLRLIQNIFNEYKIYVSNLETDGENLLDANKLLAILIYKNVYPRDFEELHRGEGVLAKVLNQQDELIGVSEKKCRTELKQLENQIEAGEKQIPSDVKELQKIYLMTLIEQLPTNTYSVSLNNSDWFALQELFDNDMFEQLINTSQIYCLFNNGYHRHINIKNLQGEVDPHKSYQQRKLEIESIATDNKNSILRKIRDLRSRIATLRLTNLNELLRLNSESMQDLFEDFGANGELARFLILEGYLDDTYYQYTTLFHSGRLSPNDNKFLIQIRAFVTPEPNFPIDNPVEVIAAMRDEDFRQSYVLNVKLVDTFLGDPSRYFDQTQKLLEFLSSEFEASEEFFEAYYTSGVEVTGLLSRLTIAWKGIVPAAIASNNNIAHITRLIANLPKSSLTALVSDFGELSKFVTENLLEVLVDLPELAPERLKCLNFEVKDLSEITEHSEIVRFMFEEGLFKLTLSNLEYIYKVILGNSDLEPLYERNFSAIRSTNNHTLIKRVERDYDLYLREILLKLPGSSEEDTDSILALICQDGLDQENLKKYLINQTAQLPDLESVPERLHVMLFKIGEIKPTWENCIAFMKSEGYTDKLLIDYFNQDVVRSKLLEHPMPNDSDSLKLRQLIINADSLSDDAYREYAHALPKSINKLPVELSSTKLGILIDEGKITFSKESLNALIKNNDLQHQFVVANISAYLEDPDSFELDDDFLEGLLRSEIDHTAKLRTIELMDLELIVGLPKRSALIGSFIQNNNVENFDLDTHIVKSLIEHSEPVGTKVKLLNKFHTDLNDDEVRQILANLPRPYSEIKKGYMASRLKKTSDNQALVSWLDSRNIISSWSETVFGEIRVNLYRK